MLVLFPKHALPPELKSDQNEKNTCVNEWTQPSFYIPSELPSQGASARPWVGGCGGLGAVTEGLNY